MINENPGATAASPTPRKNLVVMRPAKFLVAAWHMRMPPQRKLKLYQLDGAVELCRRRQHCSSQVLPNRQSNDQIRVGPTPCEIPKVEDGGGPRILVSLQVLLLLDRGGEWLEEERTDQVFTQVEERRLAENQLVDELQKVGEAHQREEAVNC